MNLNSFGPDESDDPIEYEWFEPEDAELAELAELAGDDFDYNDFAGDEDYVALSWSVRLRWWAKGRYWALRYRLHKFGRRFGRCPDCGKRYIGHDHQGCIPF